MQVVVVVVVCREGIRLVLVLVRKLTLGVRMAGLVLGRALVEVAVTRQ